LLLRTDDIEGAYVKKRVKGNNGKKTHDFFPEYPEMNKFYNHAKSSGNIKGFDVIEDESNQRLLMR